MLIIMTLSFPRGVQGPQHPNPGRPYRQIGFPRVTYLPDTPGGRKVRSYCIPPAVPRPKAIELKASFTHLRLDTQTSVRLPVQMTIIINII